MLDPQQRLTSATSYQYTLISWWGRGLWAPGSLFLYDAHSHGGPPKTPPKTPQYYSSLPRSCTYTKTKVFSLFLKALMTPSGLLGRLGGSLGCPRAPQGTPRTSQGVGHHPGTSWGPSETPKDAQGRPWIPKDPQGPPW